MTELQKKLALKNEQTLKMSLKKSYKSFISKEIRKKYSQDEIEAIVNNFLDEPTNLKYFKEFTELQTYRKECKKKIRSQFK